MAGQCLQQFSSFFATIFFFWFGALDESFHSSFGLCASMVCTKELCVGELLLLFHSCSYDEDM
jgi:hypothetical protein